MALTLTPLHLLAQTLLSGWTKIDHAEKSGLLSEADALGMRALLFAQSPKLSSAYQSDLGAVERALSDQYLSLAKDRLPEMTEDIAIAVYEELIPPPYRSNAKFSFGIPMPKDVPSEDWSFVEDYIVDLRVWYKRDSVAELNLAQKILGHLKNTIIPTQKKLTGRTHLSDVLNNESLWVRAGVDRYQPNGGDGKLDVYLFGMQANANGTINRAWVLNYPAKKVAGIGCAASASYMAVNLNWAINASDDRLASTLAHEYFHVIQNTYSRVDSCQGVFKIDEATATYIKHYVYPNYNHEHEWYEFIEQPLVSFLDTSYAAWTFFLFLEQMQGEERLVKFYEMMSSQKVFDALNSVLNGGFKKQWLENAVYEWNQDPLADGFKQWDKISWTPGRGTPNASSGRMPPIKIEKVSLNPKGQYRYEMQMKLKPLTRDFYAFDVTDTNIRSIAIENPTILNARRVQTKALVRKKGESKFTEYLWDDNRRHEYQWCLDKKDEEIELVVIVVANYQHDEKARPYELTPSFKVTNQGCHEFEAKMKARWYSQKQDHTYEMDVESFGLIFRENGRGKEGLFKNQFYSTAGQVSYNFRGREGNCRGSAFGIKTLIHSPRAVAGGLASYNVDPEAWGFYSFGAIFEDPTFNVTYFCPPPDPSYTRQHIVALSTDLAGPQVHSGEAIFKEKKTSQDGEWEVSWEIAPKKEN